VVMELLLVIRSRSPACCRLFHGPLDPTKYTPGRNETEGVNR